MFALMFGAVLKFMTLKSDVYIIELFYLFPIIKIITPNITTFTHLFCFISLYIPHAPWQINIS